MPVVNTYDGNVPTYDADEDTWGFELNTALGAQIKPTLDTYATAINASEILANGALPKAGGTMTGNIALPIIASASSADAGFKGAPGVALTPGGTKTLTNTDGGRLQVLASGNNTVTIAPGLPLWMVIPFKNQGAGTITVARGAGVTLTIDGANVNKDCTIGAYGKGVITQNAANNWSISGVVVG